MAGRDGDWLWVWEQEVSLPGRRGQPGRRASTSRALHEAREALQATQDRLGVMVNVRAGDPLRHRSRRDHHRLGGQGARAPRPRAGRDGRDVDLRLQRPAGGGRLRAPRARRASRSRARVQIGEGTYDCSWRGLADGSMIGIAIDVTARRRSEERLAHLAFHDPLDRAAQPRHASRSSSGASSRAPRATGRTVAALYIDLDQFKLVNDSLGHAAGDRVLVEVAERIRAVTRDGDLLARLGGDEFMLLCPGIGTPLRPARRPAGSSTRSTPRWSSTAPSSRSAPRSASRSGRATATRPTSCSSTPTPRCTRPSAPGATHTRSTRTTRARPAAGSR